MKNSGTSPYKSTIGGFRREQNYAEQTSMTLMVRSLEKQNNTLAQEVALLRNKNRKVAELEDKIELVLKHNNQLLNENQKLAKLINQKKSESQLWKSKFESHSAAKSSSQELQIKRLLNQIQKLKEQMCQIQHLKTVQINQIKNQNHVQLQHFKRANLNTTQMYQLQIRKLKESLDKKDYQYGDLNMKMARVVKQHDFEISKMREEKQRLRNELQYEDNEHKREIQSLKAKLEINFHGEIQNLKKQHYNQIQSIDYENNKLKDVINSKNNEIEQILNKNIKVKQNYEESILLLKRQNQSLKQKIVDNQRIAQLQLANLRQKLESMRQSEISLLKNAHSNQIQILQHQIQKLQAIINTKNIQLENYIKQRNQQRIAYQTQIAKLKTQLTNKSNQNKAIQINHQKQEEALLYQINSRKTELASLEQIYHQQVETLKNQLLTLKSILARKSEDLQNVEASSSKTIRQLQYRNQQLNFKLNQIKSEYEKLKNRSNTDLQDLRKSAQNRQRQLQIKISSLQDQNNQKDKTIQGLRKTIAGLQKQVETLNKNISQLLDSEKKLRKQLQQAKNRNLNKQNEYNRIIKDQRQRMEINFNFQLENQRSDAKNVIAGLRVQNKDLSKQIQKKNLLIDDLKKKYQQLTKKYEQVFAQQANRKGLDIKQPGWIPQTIATKGLFDVFLKTKVIQYCQ